MTPPLTLAQAHARLVEVLKDINGHLGPSWPPNGFSGRRVHDYAVKIEQTIADLSALLAAPRSAEALERRIARIASRACTGQQGESQIEYEIEELLKDALAAAPAQGQTLDVNALREAFDAGFWAWPNANEPERIALREAWIMRCVAAQGQTERLR